MTGTCKATFLSFYNAEFFLLRVVASKKETMDSPAHDYPSHGLEEMLKRLEQGCYGTDTIQQIFDDNVGQGNDDDEISIRAESHDEEEQEYDSTTSSTKKRKKSGSTKKSVAKKKKTKMVSEFLLDPESPSKFTKKEDPDVIEYIPTMLQQDKEQYLRESEQDLLDRDEDGQIKSCKLCDLGDNGITENTTEALKDVFNIERALFRKVPDPIIWKQMCARWYEKIVKPNAGIGIHVDQLTEGECRRHYCEYHDLSNPQRPIWDQIIYVIWCIKEFRKTGDIWVDKMVNGRMVRQRMFVPQNFHSLSMMSREVKGLLTLSEKIAAASERANQTNKTVYTGYMGKSSQRGGRGSKGGEGGVFSRF